MIHDPSAYQSPHDMQSKHDPCSQLSHYDHCCCFRQMDLELRSSFLHQRRLGADRWASTRKFVSHECGAFVGEPFSSIDSVEALRMSPALGLVPFIVESWPKLLCCSTGDRVAFDAEVESSLLRLIVLVAKR